MSNDSEDRELHGIHEDDDDILLLELRLMVQRFIVLHPLILISNCLYFRTPMIA